MRISGISRNSERCGRNELNLRLGQRQRDNAGGVFVPCRALGVAAQLARPDGPERDRRVGDADRQVTKIVDRSAGRRSREGVAEVKEETAPLCVDDCGTEVDPAQRREKVTPDPALAMNCRPITKCWGSRLDAGPTVPTIRPVMNSGDVKSMFRPSRLNLIDSRPSSAAWRNAVRNGDAETSAHCRFRSTD